MTDLPASHERTPRSRHRPRGVPRRSRLLLAIALVWAAPASALNAFSTRESTTPESSAERVQEIAFGCCTDPGVIDYGRQINFGPLLEGQEISAEYRSWGVLFGRGATPMAPATIVRLDYSRSPAACRKVLNGEPIFSGPEFFVFVDSLQNRWARVQKVGGSIGYADRLNSCFIAVYDAAGNMLEAKFNDQIGFQFLSIERPTADIYCVIVGDCQTTGTNCYPDPAGSALNCLSYTQPISTSIPLPDTIRVPNPPEVEITAPSVSPVGMLTLGLMLAAAGFWSVRRRLIQT